MLENQSCSSSKRSIPNDGRNGDPHTYVELRCSGRHPSCGLADERFTVSGESNYPSVRVLPGFKAGRVVGVGSRVNVICCAQERSVWPIYNARAVVKSGHEDEHLTVHGETNIFSVVNPVQQWSGFQASTVVVDRK